MSDRGRNWSTSSSLSKAQSLMILAADMMLAHPFGKRTQGYSAPFILWQPTTPLSAVVRTATRLSCQYQNHYLRQIRWENPGNILKETLGAEANAPLCILTDTGPSKLRGRVTSHRTSTPRQTVIRVQGGAEGSRGEGASSNSPSEDLCNIDLCGSPGAWQMNLENLKRRRIHLHECLIRSSGGIKMTRESRRFLSEGSLCFAVPPSFSYQKTSRRGYPETHNN